MTRKAIAQMIAGIGLPYAYDHFKAEDGQHPQGPPFICFLYPNRDDLMADNANYVPITALTVELYTDEVDFSLEERTEAALSAAGLTYGKSGPTYIDPEKMYMTTYNTEVLLDVQE